MPSALDITDLHIGAPLERRRRSGVRDYPARVSLPDNCPACSANVIVIPCGARPR